MRGNRRGCVAQWMATVTLLAGIPLVVGSPAQAEHGGWGFFDATPGCGNKIRKVRVNASKVARVQRVVIRARAGHSVSVLDVRRGRLLFTDFNCGTKRETVKYARIGRRVNMTVLQGPSRDSLHAAFLGWSGRYAEVGWNATGGTVVLDKYDLKTVTRLARRSFSGIGHLEDLDGGNMTSYLQVSDGWPGSPDARTRVMKRAGQDLIAMLVRRGQSYMHLSVDEWGLIGLSSDTAPGRLYVRGGLENQPTARVAICGRRSAPKAFTWLSLDRLGLAHCMNDMGASTYQLVDLRADTPKRTRLGLWGIQPVGMDIH
jgi:hypothetical protein